MKKCSGCSVTKDLSNYYKNYIRCKSCHSQSVKKWQENNANKVTLDNKNYRENNKLACKERIKKYIRNNPDKRKASVAKYTKNNLDKKAAIEAKRRAAKLNRTPKWLTNSDFIEIKWAYTLAAEKTRETKVPHDVDHIIPLQGKLISGLHVPSNLQIITKSLNCSKSNKVEL